MAILTRLMDRVQIDEVDLAVATMHKMSIMTRNLAITIHREEAVRELVATDVEKIREEMRAMDQAVVIVIQTALITNIVMSVKEAEMVILTEEKLDIEMREIVTGAIAIGEMITMLTDVIEEETETEAEEEADTNILDLTLLTLADQAPHTTTTTVVVIEEMSDAVDIDQDVVRTMVGPDGHHRAKMNKKQLNEQLNDS